MVELKSFLMEDRVAVYAMESIPRLLMTWWHKEPGHQQPLYWPSSSGIFVFQEQKWSEKWDSRCEISLHIAWTHKHLMMIITFNTFAQTASSRCKKVSNPSTSSQIMGKHIEVTTALCFGRWLAFVRAAYMALGMPQGECLGTILFTHRPFNGPCMSTAILFWKAWSGTSWDFGTVYLTHGMV